MSSKHGSAQPAAAQAADAHDDRLEEAAGGEAQDAAAGVPPTGESGREADAAADAEARDIEATDAERDGSGQGAAPEDGPSEAAGGTAGSPSPQPLPNGAAGAGNGSVAGGTAQLVPVSAEQLAFALGQAQAQQKPKAKKGPAFWVPVTILAVLAGLGLLAGAFFIGRSTRDSPDVVAGKVAAAKAATAKVDLGRARDALDAQRTKLKASFRTTLRRQEALSYKKGRREGEAAGYASGQSAGYASGQASGYSSGKAEGQAQGQAEGYQQGFDQGTCYTPGTLDYVC